MNYGYDILPDEDDVLQPQPAVASPQTQTITYEVLGDEEEEQVSAIPTPGSIFKESDIPKIAPMEQSSLAVAGTPQIESTEIESQYAPVVARAKKETDPAKIADIIKNFPNSKRDKFKQTYPQKQQQKIREKTALFKQASPATGMLVKTIGAGVKAAKDIVFP